MMKILLVSQNQKIPNPTSISQSFLRAFKANGVICENYDLTYYVNKYFNYIVKRKPQLRHQLLKKINLNLIDFIIQNKFSHILVVKGTFLLPETLVELQNKNIILSCFNPDDPFNPESWGGSNHPIILNSIPYFDNYFIWSKKLMPKLEKSGAKKSHYFPFAIDQHLIKYYDNIIPKYDLSFIGNSDNERQFWVNSSADLIEKEKGIQRIDVFGRYWKPHQNIIINGGRFGDDYFKVFYESKININILRNQNKQETNMRTFEIPATGNFMMHEQSEGAMEFFESDIDVVYFSSPEELIEKSIFYLKNESLRKKIAYSGYKKTFKHGYTYNDRIKKMITQISQ